MEDKTKKVMKKKFLLKFLNLDHDFSDLKDLVKREFAFLTWDKNYMIRHKAYVNSKDLSSALKSLVPRHSYSSAAVYSVPDAKKMSDKGWLGCDFVVDIDADHMDLECAHNHDYHFCQKCDYYNTGDPPQKCPECGNSKFDKQQWLCDECLEASKQEIYKIMNMFKSDFGLMEDDFHVKFSGHRGYHLEIYDSRIREFSSEDRRQLVDYLTGTNFKPAGTFKFKSGMHSYLGSLMSDPGWHGKIAQKLYDILQFDNTAEFEASYGESALDHSVLNRLYEPENYRYLKNQLKNENPNWTMNGFGKVSYSKLLEFLLSEISCEVDVPVSIDIHRLLRLQYSIHGKTGFLVQPVSLFDLKFYDPLTESLLFNAKSSSDSKDGLMKVKITSDIVPKIRISDYMYGPYQKGEIIEVPEAAAVFLICKKVADVF